MMHRARKRLLAVMLLAGAGAGGLAGAPATAQNVPPPTMVIYGNQKCPTDANGNEIVVCVRRKPGEQFRIPKELRDMKVTPENESWAARSAANDRVGASGVGSCSTVGAGGASGCYVEAGRRYKRQKQEDKADQRAMEATLP